MADKGPGSASRSGKKRLARAKIKPSEGGIQSSKGRKVVQDEPSRSEQKKARKKKLTSIAVGAFAIIMALSMTLPSLTYIFGNNEGDQPQEQASEQETEANDEQATNEQGGKDTQASSMDAVDAAYAAVVDPLEAKLKESPDDLATLLNLGNDYMSWGSEASSKATDDAGNAHVTELFDKAVSYFDRYLKLNDSVVVKTSRAMCLLYGGDTDGALEALKAITDETPEHGPAWADLGMIYEYLGKTDDAKAAYEKAAEVDADDEYGAKSYANRRLAAMAASDGEGLTNETAESVSGSDDSSKSGAEKLEDALGTGL